MIYDLTCKLTTTPKIKENTNLYIINSLKKLVTVFARNICVNVVLQWKCQHPGIYDSGFV